MILIVSSFTITYFISVYSLCMWCQCFFLIAPCFSPICQITVICEEEKKYYFWQPTPHAAPADWRACSNHDDGRNTPVRAWIQKHKPRIAVTVTVAQCCLFGIQISGVWIPWTVIFSGSCIRAYFSNFSHVHVVCPCFRQLYSLFVAHKCCFPLLTLCISTI